MERTDSPSMGSRLEEKTRRMNNVSRYKRINSPGYLTSISTTVSRYSSGSPESDRLKDGFCF